MAKVVIPLKYPVPLIQGHLIEVEVQRIRVRDRLAQEIAERHGGEGESMVALVSSNTGLDAQIVGDLDESDFAQVVAAMSEISRDTDPEPPAAEGEE